MNHSEQLNLINDAINKAKEQLKPTSVNFIFWGILITLMSLIHYLFPEFIQKTTYSSLIFWTIIPVIGMVITIIYNNISGLHDATARAVCPYQCVIGGCAAIEHIGGVVIIGQPVQPAVVGMSGSFFGSQIEFVQNVRNLLGPV